MSLLTQDSPLPQRGLDSADEAAELSRLEARLPPLLSLIAGMADFTGFFTLGHIFTAHVTGNIVLATVVAVDGGAFRWAQLSAIPVFMIALATVWLIAQASGRHGSSLARPLLQVQFLVLLALLIFIVITKPSAGPSGLNANAAATMAMSAMACQYALLRLAWPGAISTAVMTGNLTNAVLSTMDLLAPRNRLRPRDSTPLNHSLHRLLSFILGCVFAAGAVSLMADWAWSLPAALAAIAMAVH
ncbi:DUF1275 family protein [Bradyrhizobium sp. CCBAU 53338]|uniref:DUF1275 family protein n=1 Tax=Bradyrhizobium sp. CCBAU 53338 TaxID=1325111 RepID=UPI00188BE304|nr:DUF1275 family protein [Bradyrhizobium sp. CCBAU 53338]QOZ51726.1 hypothetical protein XH90_10305 [Bradyrhizobium sp. CCBAU 53338]